jgi:hypothetical protein
MPDQSGASQVGRNIVFEKPLPHASTLFVGNLVEDRLEHVRAAIDAGQEIAEAVETAIQAVSA